MRALIAIVTVLAVAVASAHAEPDPPPKLSLATESDRVAWTRPGFRLGLAVEYGELFGLRGAPSGRLIGATLHAGVRLDREWSLMTSFTYERAKSSGGLDGLRFSGTLDPTWHITRSISLAAGFGFGGIVEGATGRPDATPLPTTIDTSITLPTANPPVASCSGVGVAGVVRAEYAYVLGPRAETVVALQGIGQYTSCVDSTGRIEPDTGAEIVRRQYWPHTGVMLSWGVTWR